MRQAWIVPDWPAPPGVRAAALLRSGGVSPPPWDSLNLGDHVGDDPARVAENRRLLRLALALPEEPTWLKQVHGTDVLVLDDADAALGPVAATVATAGVATEPDPAARRIADAAVTGCPGRVLAVLTADCLPVLFCRADGKRIGIAHAGWRGLAAGVLEATLAALEAPPGEVMAWVGPGIGAAVYEVRNEVRDACLAAAAIATAADAAAACFIPGRPGRWHFDLAGLARLRLATLGVASIQGGTWCTFSDPARFYSHRRDGAERPTGRMATLIWREPA